jgi:Icc-related predicted phosphoesterase
MRFVLISDTHSLHRLIEVPDGDVLIHAGDITREGEVDTVYDFSIWFAGLPHKEKVVIPGNHDFCFDISHNRYDELARKMLEDRRPNIHFLLDSARTIAGLRFYGSPWVPNLGGWAFYDRGRDMFDRAPTDIDVLVTHAPQWLVMDREKKRGEHCGSTAVGRYVGRCPRLKLHVFGHVHEGYGTSPVGQEPVRVNACSLNREYEPVNKPIVLDLDF